MSNYLSRVFTFVLFFLFSLSALSADTTFKTPPFSGSGNCSDCHDGLIDSSEEDVSIVQDWGNSMMANATTDPFWRAKVASELKRNPDLASEINDTCSKCHAPIANYEIEEVQDSDIILFSDNVDTGVLDPSHEFYDAAINGVSCTVCHLITDDDSLGTLEGFSGEYKINDSIIEGSIDIYGQYRDIKTQPMIKNTDYIPVYSAHISDSALCATCHNLKTPFVDNTGEIIPETEEDYFPEQMPYTEWENSDFDDPDKTPRSCQDCHMPKTTAKLSTTPETLAPKDGFAKHHLAGANTTMLTLLKDNADDLDVISSDLDSGIDRARAMLKSAVNIEIVSASVNNGILQAKVKLENNSGHKTPTAYPSRRMWLHFKVTDSNNNIVFESGKINADGSITGADNDINQTVFEPHYNLITSSGQVQIYETIMGNTDDEVTFTLLRSAQYLKDNRLTPKGFNKSSVPNDVAVKGQAYNDPDFNLGSDEIIYRFPVSVAGELDISVSLNYQTIAHGFLQDLYHDNELDQVNDFKTMYDAQSLKHEVMVSTQSTVISDGSGMQPAMPAIIMLLLL